MRFIYFWLLLSQPSFALGFANGVKIGEVDSTSAIVWSRLTENLQQEPFEKEQGGAVPGMAGEVSIRYWKKGNANNPQTKPWMRVFAQHDFTHPFQLNHLRPNTDYEFELLGREKKKGAQVSLRGRFHTAPAKLTAQNIKFLISTGQRFQERDDDKNGHIIYRSMANEHADFFVQTGDAVYYDKEPLATNIDQARFKWNRIYALRNFRDFHSGIASYWIKDDHDLLKNDCWPGQTYGDITWDQGIQIWREQVPVSAKPYRTFRWGKHVQVWFPEGREFRSPNTIPDGADKTILGKEQWKWLKETMTESDATFRIFVSATPVVGPDRIKKSDNHANQGFQHEGDKLRSFLASQPGCFVICGDRHWQYASSDPKTGLKEFCSGPASDQHAGGFYQKNAVPWQSFLRVKGGFLSVDVQSADHPIAIIRHHDVTGKIVNEVKISRDHPNEAK